MAYQDQDARGRVWSTLLTANDSTAKEELGALRELSDGRMFRYVKMTGSAGALGQVFVPATLVAADGLSVGSTTNGPDGATTTLITDADASWTNDAYKGWYFKVDTGETGSEEPIKIVGNTATTLTLERQLSTTVAAGDNGEILAGNVAVKKCAVDTPNTSVVGVGIGTLTQDYYGWVQVRGIAAVLSTAALSEGESCCAGGATTAGQAEDRDASQNGILGNTIAAGGTNDYQMVDLRIV